MKLDKKEVRSRDTFLQISDKVSHWVAKNRSLVIGFFVGAVVLGAAYGVYDMYSISHENRAQESLYEARKKYIPTVADPFQNNKNPAEPKLTEDSTKAYENVINNYKGTLASKVASIELSQAFLDEGKSEPALKVFQTPMASAPKDMMSSLYLLQNAKVLEANGKCSEAIAILEKIWSSNITLKTLQTEARLRAGICYEQLSQLDKAKEMFTTASQDKGTAADTAKKYLRLMQPNAG